MRGIVEFSVNFEVDDRDPVVLINTDRFAHRGKRFRTTHFRAMGNTYGDDIGEWSWYRYGVILKDNGEPRKDGLTASAHIKSSDVPGYVQRALSKEIERRAKLAHEEIDAWVQAAKDQVTDTEVGIMKELS
jgi:hypothetical protein